MSDGTDTWQFSYNADGLRTKRESDSHTYTYRYDGDQLRIMSVDNVHMSFVYNADGPMAISYSGTTYYYTKNLQGDITGIVDSNGNSVVEYTYDAWGNPSEPTGSLASTLGAHNPLRYRSYIYDSDTQLYYLQSRYYNPEVGRFINGDALVSTGQGILGNNMCAYCTNNPIAFIDPDGMCIKTGYRPWLSVTLEYIDCGQKYCPYKISQLYPEEYAVLNGDTDEYKGVKVHKVLPEGSGFSFGDIFIDSKIDVTFGSVNLLRHEYGHTVQLKELGYFWYALAVVAPSVSCFALSNLGILEVDYYSLPWEVVADFNGGVERPGGYDIQYAYFYMDYEAFIACVTRNEEKSPIWT